MNREEAKQLADKHSFKEVETTGRYLIPRRVVHVIIDSLNEDFETKFEKEQNANLENEIAKNIIIESLRKENTRLKKQLASNHHIECSCSFCKPVGEEKDCDNCLNIQGISDCCQYCIRGEGFSKDYWKYKC